MAKEIKVPQIGDGVESATVSEVLVAEGDKIEKDQSVIAVESFSRSSKFGRGDYKRNKDQ